MLAERFISSALKFALEPESIEFVLYVDIDDSESRKIFVEGAKLIRIVGARTSMGSSNSECFSRASGEIVLLGNDDVQIRTERWDEKIIEAHRKFKDKIYLAYPNDLYKGKKLSAFPIFSRRTLELLKDPFPASYKGSFIDTHLMEIFIRLRHLGENRIIYLEDVIFEHLHFRSGKAVEDKTYKDRDRFADDLVFLGLSKIRQRTAQLLLKTIRGTNEQPSWSILDTVSIKPDQSILSMVGNASRSILGMTDLPLFYRLKFFTYMILRWGYARSKFLPDRKQ